MIGREPPNATTWVIGVRVGLQRAPGAVERVRRVVLDRAREVAPARLVSRSPTGARAAAA